MSEAADAHNTLPVSAAFGDLNDRPRIGLIAGSGPEAGLDLWSKILVANRTALAERFRDDTDAPAVVVFSEPALGLASDLRANDAMVWRALEQTVRRMAPHVDIFTIACNTLHHYASAISEICDVTFVTVADVVREYIESKSPGPAALVGTASVMALDDWSPYRGVHADFPFETPSDFGVIRRLIGDIKYTGEETPELRSRFIDAMSSLDARTVFLACTELPIMKASVPGKVLVDINKLLADRLVHYSLTHKTVRSGTQG